MPWRWRCAAALERAAWHPPPRRPYVPFLAEATRPGCECEGCPDGPGRASTQGGRVVRDDSEAFVAFDTSKLRNAVAIAGAGRSGEVRFLAEIENTPAATAKLERKLAGKYTRLSF